jgi:ABC-type multidrug transport system permease subunit
MVKRAYVGDLLSRKVWGLLLAAWAVAALVSLGGAVVLWAAAGVDESFFYGLLFAFLLWLVVNLPAGLFLALHLGSGRMLRGFAYVWLAPVVTLLLRA